MKTAAIIGIGTELMKGRIDDTNATFLSRWLSDRGVRVVLRANVPDTVEAIAAALRSAAACDLVLATGGLGPTADDLTREALAAHLQKELVFDQELWRAIEAIFKKRLRTVAESNRRQAYTIPGAEPLPNPVGTAPGLWYAAGPVCYALLPGPPNENKPMIETALKEKLLAHGFLSGELAVRILRCHHAGESALADMLQVAVFETEVGYYFSQEGYVDLEFSRFSGRGGEGERAVAADAAKAALILEARGVFFTGPEPLSRVLLETLRAHRLTVAFAESVTGGAMAAELVKNPGASEVLRGGIVAYSNRVKEKLLDVSPETLRESGAVSADAVREMAWGLRQATGADVCVSVSGIAGPAGGSEAKPVGLVHFGFLIRDRYAHRVETFFPGRERVIKRATAFAYAEIIKALGAGAAAAVDRPS